MIVVVFFSFCTCYNQYCLAGLIEGHCYRGKPLYFIGIPELRLPWLFAIFYLHNTNSHFIIWDEQSLFFFFEVGLHSFGVELVQISSTVGRP
jgi:hypothetical protein